PAWGSRPGRGVDHVPRDDEPRRHDGARRGADPQLADDREQHVRLAAVHARAPDEPFDGATRGVLGGELDRRAEAEDLHGVVHLEDRAVELPSLLELHAGADRDVALDARARDDPVADRGRGVACWAPPGGGVASRSTTTASPGRAPRLRTGPGMGASGWPSHAGVNGVGTVLMSAMSENAPRTSRVNASPVATSKAGGVEGLTSNRYQRLSVVVTP